MIADYNDKREAVAEMLDRFKRAHAFAPYGTEMRADFARWVDILTGIDEDLIRAHCFRDVAIEYEAPPIPRNKGGRPRNPVQTGAMAS